MYVQNVEGQSGCVFPAEIVEEFHCPFHGGFVHKIEVAQLIWCIFKVQEFLVRGIDGLEVRFFA